MAGFQLSTYGRIWVSTEANLIATAELLGELGLAHREQYDSLNAFITLASWRFLSEEWVNRQRPNVVTAHNVRTRVDALLREHATRFLILSAWAKKWSETGGGTALLTYAEELAEDHTSSTKDEAPALVARLEARLVKWVADAIPGAEQHIAELQAERRDGVRRYYMPLWVWHRLNPERRANSKLINLKGRKKAVTDVDHIVSFAGWQRRIDGGERPAAEVDGWEDDINQLGNCFLLEKNFNISKTDKPLAEWLKQLDAFSEKASLEAWRTALDLPVELVDSAAPTLAELQKQILERTKRVKTGLLAFIHNEAKLPTGGPMVAVEGTWSTSYEDKGKRVDAPMLLRQEGAGVTGTYRNTCTLNATLRDLTLVGTWTEGGVSGQFSWGFTADGARFTGTWGPGTRSSGGGAWTGAKAPPS